MDQRHFNIFENTDWSAAEEVALLSAIEEFGYGNWINISRRITTRSPDECKYHYNTFYINKPSELLPKLPSTNKVLPNIVTPYNFRLKQIEEPPRALPSVLTLAGYSAARSDFENPFDSNAEEIISSVSETYANYRKHDELIDKLVCSVFCAYNNRLKERYRCYRVIRDHGLIHTRKSYVHYLQNKSLISRHAFEKFQGFAQFMSASDFDYIIHSLYRQSELRTYLNRLKDLRRKGIRTISGVRLYNKLKVQREKSLTDIQNFFDRPDVSLSRTFTLDGSGGGAASSTNRRSVAAPLDIIGLPGYDRLTEEEKKMCSIVRLIPESYLEFKNILIEECEKSNGLRLQNARKAIRIDVNKTRKLYDFLIEQGHIRKPNENV